MAPMEFQKLLDRQQIEHDVKTEIENLLKRKIEGDELKEEPKIQILNNFLERKIQFYNEYVNSLEQFKQPETLMLNELFRNTIIEAWEK